MFLSKSNPFPANWDTELRIFSLTNFTEKLLFNISLEISSLSSLSQLFSLLSLLTEGLPLGEDPEICTDHANAGILCSIFHQE